MRKYDMVSRYLHPIINLQYSLCSSRFHMAIISIAVIIVSLLGLDLNNAIIFSSNDRNNKGIAYAHIFNDTSGYITQI